MIDQYDSAALNLYSLGMSMALHGKDVQGKVGKLSVFLEEFKSGKFEHVQDFEKISGEVLGDLESIKSSADRLIHQGITDLNQVIPILSAVQLTKEDYILVKDAIKDITNYIHKVLRVHYRNESRTMSGFPPTASFLERVFNKNIEKREILEGRTLQYLDTRTKQARDELITFTQHHSQDSALITKKAIEYILLLKKEFEQEFNIEKDTEIQEASLEKNEEEIKKYPQLEQTFKKIHETYAEFLARDIREAKEDKNLETFGLDSKSNIKNTQFINRNLPGKEFHELSTLFKRKITSTQPISTVLAILQIYLDIRQYLKNNGKTIDEEAYFRDVKKVLERKRVLEIGPGANGGNILILKNFCNSIDATIIDTGRNMDPYKLGNHGVEKKEMNAVFHPAGINTIYINDFKDEDYEKQIIRLYNALNKIGPFDIIISERVFYDGDCGSIAMEIDDRRRDWRDTYKYNTEMIFWFQFYNIFLKRGGISAHNFAGRSETLFNELLSGLDNKILNKINSEHVSKLKYIGNNYIFTLFTKE
ncbi:MAG: hypothetical protein WC916_03100 [Candidatus Woesearchaeota archaeon]